MKTKRVVGIVGILFLGFFLPIVPVNITPRVEMIVVGCNGEPLAEIIVTLKSSSPYEFSGYYADRVSDAIGKVVFEKRLIHVSSLRLLIIGGIELMSAINPHVDTHIRTAVFFKDRGSGYISFLDGEHPPSQIVYCSS